MSGRPRLVKMSGTGNDFILLGPEQFAAMGDDPTGWIRRICRRRLSVGARNLESYLGKPIYRTGDEVERGPQIGTAMGLDVEGLVFIRRESGSATSGKQNGKQCAYF